MSGNRSKVIVMYHVLVGTAAQPHTTIVCYFPTRSEVNLKNRWTMLSNRDWWELDIHREKRQLVITLDNVIAGAAAHFRFLL
jgi:hypothetical protein